MFRKPREEVETVKQLQNILDRQMHGWVIVKHPRFWKVYFTRGSLSFIDGSETPSGFFITKPVLYQNLGDDCYLVYVRPKGKFWTSPQSVSIDLVRGLVRTMQG